MVTPRVNHYITANHATYRPTRHLFFDVETAQIPLDDKRTEQRLKLGWCLYWRTRPDKPADTLQWLFFETIPQFWTFVLSKCHSSEQLYMASHNLNFDFSVLKGFDTLSARGWELESAYNKGSTSIIRLTKDKYKIVAIDNQNWWKCSLKVLGELVGLAKLDTDPLTAEFADLSPYCHRDVEIIYRAWQMWYAFCDQHDLGKWSFTLPAQAMAAYRHRFMPCKLLVHTDLEALTLEREAYRGGRSSVLRKGTFTGETFYKLDINSAYPWAMKTCEMPTLLYQVYSKPSFASLERWLKSYLVVARVQLVTDDNPFPVLYQGHNIYPIGAFETTLSTPEIVYALEHGWIKAILKCAVYRKAKIFDDYVNYFYALKARYQAEDNPVFYRLAKLLLNGNYGKWGQLASHFEKWQESSEIWDDVDHVIDLVTGKNFKLYHFGNWLYREIDDGESNNSMPAIAGHITAYVRMYLFDLLARAGRRNVYLCDTDSLIVNQAGYDNLAAYMHPSDLGKLKLEATAESLVTLAPKNYCFGDSWTRKAIPPKAQETSPNTWHFTKFISIRGLATQPRYTPYFTEATSRTLSYKLYDGIPDRDGFVVPLNASKLDLHSTLPEEVEIQLAEIDMQMEGLREARTIPPAIIFNLWDFTKGAWKRQRNKFGLLVPAYEARADEIASELGYTDLDHLQSAVRDQIAVDEQITQLKADKQAILYRASINRSQEHVLV